MTEHTDGTGNFSDKSRLRATQEISAAESIGLIGVGLLGSAIAERLMLAGRPVTGFDVSETCRLRLQEFGGHVADSAAGVFQYCRVVILSLPDSDVVQRLIDDVAEAIDSHLIIDTTTGSPDRTRLIGSRLEELGTGFLDATVVGSSEHVRRGEAVMLVGGKLIVNLVLGLNRAVLAEGLSLARGCGVDLPQMLEILQSGAAYSRVMDTKGPKMLSGDFTPQARLDQHWKDVRLILELGRKHGAVLPLSQIHEGLLEQASAMGLGASDNSAVIRAFEVSVPTSAATR